MLWWGIGDNAYAPQPRDLRLCWKIRTTSTSNQHHQQRFDLPLCWKIHTTSTSKQHHQQPWTCVCVGKSTPPARQTITTSYCSPQAVTRQTLLSIWVPPNWNAARTGDPPAKSDCQISWRIPGDVSTSPSPSPSPNKYNFHILLSTKRRTPSVMSLVRS